ncbi:hypothetical protein TNCV_2758731 [Trichonephila clavipes]|nr:hypothetical protein TNCV_2758731 [Trichonephila clavipes]
MPPDRHVPDSAHEIRQGKGLNCTPVVSRSLKYHAVDRTLWIASIPILRENTLGEVRGLPPLFSFRQPHERTCISRANSASLTTIPNRQPSGIMANDADCCAVGPEMFVNV